MIAKKLKEILDNRKMKYSIIKHPEVFTTQEASEAAHLSSHAMAKSVIVKLDDELVMTVLPANKKINLEKLRDDQDAKIAELAAEDEFKFKFPDCELGAIPPFGNLYGMELYVDESLKGHKELGFCAGTHHEILKMNYKDYEKITKPIYAKLTD